MSLTLQEWRSTKYFRSLKICPLAPPSANTSQYSSAVHDDPSKTDKQGKPAISDDTDFTSPTSSSTP
ncbi:hypothetical protein DERP_008607 [Dermatophagoides pteronyssinus]|uniref:Uncharacterized protein n=1 Tax=Dermatophagoides pteronyssinus TaxID=6956 RepID=A0ABQ8IWQ7_DERPT|nr:hypothetical protein DERP_008607 [Dermatophagoides pteronyssinus]